MDIILIVVCIICLIAGLLGCFIPIIPGPPLAYAGLLLLHLTGRAQFSMLQLGIWLAVVIVVQFIDYLIPTLGSKYSGGSKWGTRGCFVGTIVGLFFLPWGLVLGPFLGAFIGELLAGQATGRALLSGVGSLLGLLAGTVLKCVVCGYFLWQFVLASSEIFSRS